MSYENDQRVVLTLDAGGTNFVFVAMRGGKRLGRDISLPAEAHDLDKSLANMKAGFYQLIRENNIVPAAISFAFPGPADYPNGVIYNVGNLPGYAGGVALANILQEEFKVPVFINNDGDLFVYGEAMSGFLPKVNKIMETAGRTKRYRNLFGVTLGTGFGGGLVVDGDLYMGDNSNAMEVWILRNKVRPESYAEEGVSIRAVQKAYAARVGLDDYKSLSGMDIEDIAMGRKEGNPEAARAAYKEMGHVLGEVFATAATLFDALIVIGGGLSYGHRLFMDAVLEEMNGTIVSYEGKVMARLAQKAYNLEDPEQLAEFTRNEEKRLKVYGTDRDIVYDPLKRIGIGITTLGTSEAVAAGAYAYALNAIDRK